MTNEQIKARCVQFLERLRIDPSNLLSDNMESTESLCLEMIATGLKRAATHFDESDSDNAWAYANWCRQEAQRVKENHDTKEA